MIKSIQNPRYKWPVHIALLFPLASVILYVGITHGFWGDGPKTWHENLRNLHPLITTIIKFVSDYAAITLYAVYLIIFIRSLKQHDTNGIRFLMRFALGTLLVTVGATYLIKAGMGLPRPGVPFPQQPFSFERAYSSFPSGHTTEIIAAALPLAFWLKKIRWQILLAIIIGIVGYSRLWLGAHHPVDIYGGMIMGSIAARFIYLPTVETRHFHAKTCASLPPATNG